MQASPGKMAWLFEPYLQDLYERRQWKEIERFEEFSPGARLVAALVLATARTGELVSSRRGGAAGQVPRRPPQVAGRRTCSARTCDRRLPRQAGRRDAELVRRGAGRLRRAARSACCASRAPRPAPTFGAPARAPALVPGRRRRSRAVPRPRAGAGGRPGGAARRAAPRPRPQLIEDLVGLVALVPDRPPTDAKAQAPGRS